MRTTETEIGNKLFRPEVAIATAEKMNADDADWSYEVVHCPKGTGLSYIRVRDKDGVIIGKI